MPIRLNLLAEAQALEELRRRDPVKRALWVAAFLVIAMLGWGISLQVQAMAARRESGVLESQIAAQTKPYQAIVDKQKRLGQIQQRLDGLHDLAANRFLNGTILNALQKTTFDDLQLMRFKAEQTYLLNEEVKAHTNAADKFIPTKPASVTERIVVTLDAKDNGTPAGDMVNKYKDALAGSEYFQKMLASKNDVKLLSFSPAQAGADGKQFVLFTVECRYPEKTR
jgi:hypothetical protein